MKIAVYMLIKSDRDQELLQLGFLPLDQRKQNFDMVFHQGKCFTLAITRRIRLKKTLTLTSIFMDSLWALWLHDDFKFSQIFSECNDLGFHGILTTEVWLQPVCVLPSFGSCIGIFVKLAKQKRILKRNVITCCQREEVYDPSVLDTDRN